jgi:hypothetical protein
MVDLFSILDIGRSWSKLHQAAISDARPRLKRCVLALGAAGARENPAVD